MSNIKTAAEVSDVLRAQLDIAVANPKEIFGYARYGDDKSWPHLNHITGGIQVRKFDVLGAAPKEGKSRLAASWLPGIAEQAMYANKVVRVVSAEMTTDAYQMVSAAYLAEIADPMNIMRGKISKAEEKRYRNALKYLAALPIEWLSNDVDMDEETALQIGASSLTFNDVNSFIRKTDTGETFWWLLDHMLLLNDDTADGDVTRSAYRLSRKLAWLCHHVATGLIITHLTRDSRGSMPNLQNIGNSYQIAKDCDTFLGLLRPFNNDNVSQEDRDAVREEGGEVAYLNVISRNVAGGLDVLFWNMALASFNEMHVDEGVKLKMPSKPKRK